MTVVNVFFFSTKTAFIDYIICVLNLGFVELVICNCSKS